jgi:hypothetical protein
LGLSELNAKKIETLTKVARLLGEQIQTQSRAINKLQNDIDWIKESLRRKTQEDSPSISERPPKIEEVTSDIFLPEQEEPNLSATEPLSIKETLGEKKETSEKEELLQALKIIDNL